MLSAYERAEVESDAARQRALLTFVVVGGGPTGVELAGALGEMSRFTLARDFRNIDPALARVILIEAGPRILPSFPESLARRAMRDLEALGVQVWTASPVTRIDAGGVEVGRERIETATTLWARACRPRRSARRSASRSTASAACSSGATSRCREHPEVFVLGDQAHAPAPNGAPLPGLAPVAMQQGRFVARAIRDELRGRAARRLPLSRPRPDGDDRPQPRDLRHRPRSASAASRPGCSGSASTSTSWWASRTACSWCSSGRGPISPTAAARA